MVLAISTNIVLIEKNYLDENFSRTNEELRFVLEVEQEDLPYFANIQTQSDSGEPESLCDK